MTPTSVESLITGMTRLPSVNLDKCVVKPDTEAVLEEIKSLLRQKGNLMVSNLCKFGVHFDKWNLARNSLR